MILLEKWTGDVVKKMHIYGIKQNEIAKEMGVSREVVCKTLSGKYHLKNGKERFTSAIDSILAKHK